MSKQRLKGKETQQKAKSLVKRDRRGKKRERERDGGKKEIIEKIRIKLNLEGTEMGEGATQHINSALR